MVTAEIASQSRLAAAAGRNARHDDERLPCGSRRRIRIPARQPRWFHPGEEEALQHHVLRARPPPAVAFPSSRRRERRLRRVIELASLAKPTYEVDVLHQ